jgi:putative methyltransferase (TIGR04325 family)
MTLRHTIGRYVPHTVRALLNDLGPHGYSGRFPTYDAARASAASTDEPDAMIERTAEVTAAVRDGAIAYEQDSVAMEPPSETRHLLDAIRALAARQAGRAHVVDFGGGLGSKFFWARRALGPAVDLRWTVVELDRHVSAGRQRFASDALHFEGSLDGVSRPIDVVACYSALQYLPDPVAGVRALASVSAGAIVIDRMPYATGGRAEVTLQHVDARIYHAALPSWLLDEPEIRAAIEACGYRLAERFEYPRVYTRRAVFAGHVFTRAVESSRS